MTDPVKTARASDSRATRRAFLASAGFALTTLCVRDATGQEAAAGTRPAGNADDAGPARGPRRFDPWWLSAERPRSRVVDIRSDRVLQGASVNPLAIETMLARGVQAVAETADASEAWRTILGDAQKVLLKFNKVGAELLATSPAIARALLSQISDAGYSPKLATIAEVPGPLTRQLGVAPLPEGWGDEIPVGHDFEPLANWLLEADAIVNIGFLKTHAIAGMSACCINLSHSAIRRPARWHANGCAPSVGEVIGSAPVASRLKLNIVNALRVVVENGADAREADLERYGGLLLGRDPVAVDSVGLSLLDVLRRRHGIESVVNVPYLAAAGRDGVGRNRPADIDRVQFDVSS